jgi:hypothetical protein
MDSVTTIICCNCAIAIVVTAITLGIVSLRQQVVALTEWCDRWERECDLFLSDAPRSIATSRIQILQLSQIYQQQLLTLDRLQSLRSSLGIARVLLVNRRRSRNR